MFRATMRGMKKDLVLETAFTRYTLSDDGFEIKLERERKENGKRTHITVDKKRLLAWLQEPVDE